MEVLDLGPVPENDRIPKDLNASLLSELQSVVLRSRQDLLDGLAQGGEAVAESREFSTKMVAVARQVYDEVLRANSASFNLTFPSHALLLAGSGGRYEMAYNSDLEFLVSFDQGCPSEDYESVILTNFKIALKQVKLNADDVNMPRKQKMTLGCTPSQLVGNLLMSTDEVKTNFLLGCSYLAGDRAVAREVKQLIDFWLQKTTVAAAAEAHISNKKLTKVEQTLGAFVFEEVQRWNFGNSMERLRTWIHDKEYLSDGHFSVKTQLMRPLHNIIYYAYFLIPRGYVELNVDDACNVERRLERLESKNIIPHSLAREISTAYSTAMRLRILAQHELGGENEYVCLSCITDLDALDVQTRYEIKEDSQKKSAEKAFRVVGCLLSVITSWIDNRQGTQNSSSKQPLFPQTCLADH